MKSKAVKLAGLLLTLLLLLATIGTLTIIASAEETEESEKNDTVQEECTHADLEKIRYTAEGPRLTAVCDNCNNVIGEAEIDVPQKQYDGATPTVAIRSSGCFEGLEFEVIYFAGETQLDEAPTNAGNYTAKFTAFDATAETYFTIAKCDPTFTAPTPNTPLTYNGAEQELISEGVVDMGGEMQYSLNGVNFSSELPCGINAGEYTIYFKVEESENYNASEIYSLTAKIDKAPAPTVEIPSASSITYGNRLSSSALTGGSTLLGSFAWKDGTILPTVNNSGYSAVFTPNAITAQNYNITDTEFIISITVNKKALTVTAEDKIICTESKYALTYKTDGFIGSDTFITAPKLTSDANTTVAGEYAITISGAQVSENYSVTYVDATLTVREHLWNEGETTEKPTCTEKGIKTFTCTHDKTHVKTEKIEMLKHTEVTDKAKVPTCTEDGLTKGKHCSVCKTVTVAQETVPALGHTEVTDELKAPTCTEDGLSEGKHCSVCNAVITEQKVLSALDHAWEDASYDAPKTCKRCKISEGDKLYPPETEAIKPSKSETDKKNDIETEESGCFATLPLSTIAMIAAIGTAIVIKKKKD